MSMIYNRDYRKRRNQSRESEDMGSNNADINPASEIDIDNYELNDQKQEKHEEVKEVKKPTNGKKDKPDQEKKPDQELDVNKKLASAIEQTQNFTVEPPREKN